MSEEEKIKQFEEKQLDKLLIELKDIDNFKRFEDGAFKYSLSKYQADLLLEHIDNLQQEHNILTKCEKWLKKELFDKTQIHFQYSLALRKCFDKLQELKEGNNEKI